MQSKSAAFFCREFLLVIFMCFGLSWLYFRNIKSAGLFQWDPASYAVEATIGSDLLSHVFDPAYLQNEFKASLIQYNSVLPYAILPRGVAKPTYIWLLSIFTGVSRLQQIATVSFSIVVGLLLIVAVYLIGNSVGNPTVGFWSALFFGISPFHIFLSRTGYGNDLATLFFLFGLLSLFRNWIWICGILMGLAFTSHYGIVANLFFFGAFFLLVVIYGQSDFPQATFLNGVKILCGFCFVLISWEIGSRGLIYFYATKLGFHNFSDYFTSVFSQMHGSVSLRHSFYKTSQLAFFPRLFYISQGAIFLIFLSMAVGYALLNFYANKGRIKFWFIFIQATFLTLSWVFNRGFLASRIGSFLLPFYCVVMADALFCISNITLRWGLSGILAATLVSHIPSAMANQAGYQEAANFIISYHPDRILIGPGMISQLLYYLGPKKIAWDIKTIPAAQSTNSNTIELAAVDYRDFYVNKTEHDHFLNLFDGLKPIAIFNNPASCNPLNIYDQIEFQFVEKHPEACKIYIYDVSSLLRPAS